MRYLIVILLLCWSVHVAHAIQTRKVSQYSFEDFYAGDIEHLTVTHQGELKLGPSLEVVAELDESIVFDAVWSQSGNLYLGTGNNGIVYRVDEDGESEVIFESDELLIRALAVNDADDLFIATSPKGKVYRLRDGENPEVYFDPDATYVWDMLFDDAGNLYVATGDPARVFKLPPDYKLNDEPSEFFKSTLEHFTLLKYDNTGNLLVASSPEAYLYRVSPEGEGEVIFNADADEITAIEVDAENTLYFSTMGSDSGSEESAMDLPLMLEKAQAALAATVVKSSPVKNGKGTNGAAATTPKRPSFIHRLDDTGFVDYFWSPGKANIYTLFPRADEAGWIVGTDTNGRLFSVNERGEWKLLQQAENAGDISVILRSPQKNEEAYVITSNPAVVYRLTKEPTEEGLFVSNVIDVKQIAKWGALRPLGRIPGMIDGIEWETRTGNTDIPDSTWSEFESTEGLIIQSPMGRYLQYQATFTEPEAFVRAINVFYTFKNKAPIISRVNVLPVGIQIFNIQSNKKPNVDLSSLTSGNAPNPKKINRTLKQTFRVTGDAGFASVGWRAIDPNGDSLIYDLRMRGDEDEDWVLLAEDLETTAFSVNTRGFEDGYYIMEVTASDSISNTEEDAEESSHQSQPFLIDNTNPQVSLVDSESTEGGYTLTFKAEDAFSIIEKVEYNFNGKGIRQKIPDDQLFDELNETFTFVYKDLEPGKYSLIIEVFEASGNRGVAKETFLVE